MVPHLNPRNLHDFAAMSPREMGLLLAQARGLQSASPTGGSTRALRGKNLGLLCDTADDAGAALFQRAATALGAQVAQLRPNLSASSTSQEVQHTARVLGRLYDAVNCVGMAPELVRCISVEAGVPVFDGLASSAHPTAALVDGLDAGSSPEDRRCFVIQAVLLNVLA
jgi:ornithine carbamoyltransferase